MRKRYKWITLLLLCSMLQGCAWLPDAAEPERDAGNIVLQVSVESLPANEAQARLYTDTNKIQAVLDYIQSLQLVEPDSDEPEISADATCQITLRYSTGEGKVYYVSGEQYFREGDAPWMQVDGASGVSLQEILQENTSDVPTSPAEYREDVEAPSIQNDALAAES